MLLVLLLVIVPAVSLWTMPSASALGCDTETLWRAEGPYSLQGFTSVANTSVVYDYILTLKPGTEAIMKFAFKYDTPPIMGVTLRPAAGVLGAGTIDPVPSWLSVFFGPGVAVVPDNGILNVTAVLRVSNDAPPNASTSLMLYGEPQDDDYDRSHCQYAPLDLMLKVAPKNASSETATRNVTITTTLTSVTTATTKEQVTEPSTYAWALSATVAAVVLAVVLLLQRRSRTHLAEDADIANR